MTPSTAEWVNKAEGDFGGVLVLRRSRRLRRYDLICFLCQQCVEKYLKARLNEAGIPFPKTHDLALVLNLAVRVEPLWESLRQELRGLTDAAVATRYPGHDSTRQVATEAYTTCTKVRGLAGQSFGLTP
jgi:HEPN domain-containing protein